MRNRELGAFGETIAVKCLLRLGWVIIATNYRLRFGEIDIIARDTDQILVFVEVKTLRVIREGLEPEDHLSPTKLRRLQLLGSAFANAHSSLVSEKGWRIDLVAVSVKRRLLTEKPFAFKVRLYRNLL